MKYPSIVNVLLVGYVICFILDSTVNQFVDIPILNLYLIFQLVAMIAFYISNRIILKSVLIVSISLVLSVFISALQYSFEISDISDFLYLANFILYTGLLFKYYQRTSINLIYFSFGLAVLLFLPTFFGYDGKYESSLGSTSEDLEYLREYHTGFYRVPHIASYFFSFYFLTFLYCYQISKQRLYLLLSVLSLIFSFYVGSRAMVFAIVMSVGLYVLKKNKVIILPLMTGIVIGFFAIIEQILVVFQGTIAFQYFSFFQTLAQNTSRLSRLIIWNSWFQEMKNFSPLEYLFGKSFSESLAANFKNIDMQIWFHNDILSIIFSYGIIVLVFYLFFLRAIYVKHQDYISNNVIIFSFFVAILLAAVFNGFYYYHTTIIIYLFFYLIKILANENSNTGHPGYSQ